MRVGYARVSSIDQNLVRQIMALKKARVEKIFQEKVSGKNTQRKQLQSLLKFIRQDDEVFVLSLDRLGRNSRDLTQIIEHIRQCGAVLNILDLPSFDGIKDNNLKALLTNLVLEIQKYTAENERIKIRERQQQGIQAAKLRGVYHGRRPDYTANSRNPQKRVVYEQIVALLAAKAQGQKIAITEIARRTGVSRNTVYHIQRQINKNINR